MKPSVQTELEKTPQKHLDKIIIINNNINPGINARPKLKIPIIINGIDNINTLKPIAKAITRTVKKDDNATPTVLQMFSLNNRQPSEIASSQGRS